ncbi:MULTISPECIES: M30 family zinc metallopeptidase [unclassified Variovorax]|uniref:M30 family zinc metallopeptidase n=1 Tax=unclassified Variovorax TaxID=663243 RepID=UPI00131839C4|nr:MULTISPECIES: hemagglutinin [unclassified Variovorax]VTU42183.1 Peptidase M30 [Variovorax sp. SRS16]VTU42215.1 Peptidase M30 [Variovorax sp. PBL-E5]VTU44301.1 Peptidase M30 [Variovorax sp. PBL-H6]
MYRYRTKSLLGFAAGLAVAVALTACGGGGGGGGGGGMMAFPETPTTPPVVEAPQTPAQPTDSPLVAACTGCGAVDQNTYGGSGTGVWQASNTSTIPVDIPVSIKGLNGQLVTLVFTNESAEAVPMPALQIYNLGGKTQLLSKSVIGDVEPNKVDVAAKAEISEFNRAGFGKLLGGKASKSMYAAKLTAPTAPSQASGYAVGQQRTVYLNDRSQRTVRLADQKMTGDGTMVNVWVEASELAPARVSDALVTRMRDTFAGTGGIYDMLVKVGGPLWGPHAESFLLDGTAQPIDIFFVNFDQNNQAYGLGGYFWALNNFKKDGDPQLAMSNESLSLYMDTETMYLDGERGLKQIVTALAHEGMHMQNFYRRGVQMGVEFTFDIWLEEMSALMMEDWASFKLDEAHNAIRDVRFPSYLNYRGVGSYNCSLLNWTPMAATCESYAVSGSFGGFLNRQFGLGFFKSVLNSTGIEDSADILDAAIKAQRAGSGIGKELRRFSAASAGLVPVSSGVPEYTMPARSEEGFNLVDIDPAFFGEVERGLPSAVPAQLESLASFPVTRYHATGTYNETIRVPQGTTLTVIVN